MGKPAKLIAALSTVCVCAIVLAFSLVSVGPLDQGQGPVSPFRSAADLVANAGESEGAADTASANIQPAAVSESEAVSEAAEDDSSGYEHGEVLVSLSAGVTPGQAREAIAQETGLQDVSVESLTDSVAKIAFSGNTTVKDAVKAISVTDVVERAQPNFKYYPETSDTGSTVQDASAQSGGLSAVDATDLLEQKATINDPKATMWSLENLDAFDAWDLVAKAKNPKNVTVAVIDAGFRLTHEEFAGNFVYDAKTGKYDRPLVVAPYNSYLDKAGAKNINAESSHGQHVMGIIAAHANNGKGIAGVANNRVQIMPIQAFDKSGDDTNTASLVRAFDYIAKKASDYNVRVVNMSVGAGMNSSKWDEEDLLTTAAMAAVHDKGVVVVSSAGNANKKYTPPFYHSVGDFEQTVQVINLENSNHAKPKTVSRAEDSNYNTADQMVKDISAPGTDIVSASHKNDSAYVELSGTSMASPMVASVMALMFSVNDKLSVDEAVSKLYSAASPLYSEENNLGDPIWSSEFGYGAANALHAVSDEEYLSGATSVYTNEKRTYKLNLPAGVNANADDVKWRIYKTVGGNVASLKANGMKATLTGQKGGACVLFASVKVDGRLYRAVQTVTVYDADVTGPSKMTVGDRDRFFPAWSPTSNGREWIWKSSNPKVASVNSNGLVTAKRKGTVTLTATLSSNKNVTTSKRITVLPANIGAKGMDISANYNIPTYTGKPQKPAFKVLLNGGKKNEIELVEGKDYKVTYSNNVNAGNDTATAQIEALPGSLLCTGSVDCSFTIKPASLNKATLTNVKNRRYTGRPVPEQDPIVTVGQKTLKRGVDYVVRYENSLGDRMPASKIRAKSFYYVVAVGKGNYQGSAKKMFQVV